MAAALLGYCACPLCGGRAKVSLSKSDLAVMTCNSCRVQLFTRDGKSDELLRDRIKADAAPAVTPPAPPPPKPAKAPPPPPAPTPAPAPETRAQPAAPRAGGMLSSWFTA